MSDDEKEKKRPNAKYKLSHEKIQGEEIVYHYNRERRLEKSSQAVRDMYNEPPRRRFGFMHALTSSRPNALLFGTIIFLCAVMVIFSYLGLAGNTSELEGNILSVKGNWHEGAIIINVKKTFRKDKFARSTKPYTGPVNIAVFLPAKKGMEQQTANIFRHRIFFTNEQEEHYYFTVPFNQSELAFIFQTEKKSLNMTIKVAGSR